MKQSKIIDTMEMYQDAASHLNTFVKLCDMQKKKDVDNDIVKLKLFPFSLRDRAKTWFSSLP
jgi:hypothetical protein